MESKDLHCDLTVNSLTLHETEMFIFLLVTDIIQLSDGPFCPISVSLTITYHLYVPLDTWINPSTREFLLTDLR